MKKQILLAAGALLITTLLFLFGKTSLPVDHSMNAKPEMAVQKFDIEQFINESKQKFSPAQTLQYNKLENVVRGDVQTQATESYLAMAKFWRDTIKVFEPYAYYTSRAAKLENSEKSLNFAGQLFLNGIRSETDPSKINWQTTQAVELFEKALAIDPNNTEAKIGLGSAYIFGNANSANPTEAMKGIQQLLAVVREDSTNMRAQLMLGIGGMVSGQTPNAIKRLEKVVAAEPNNIEAIAFLADAHASAGNKEEAIKWYEASKNLIKDPHYVEEVNNRIKQLKTRK